MGRKSNVPAELIRAYDNPDFEALESASGRPCPRFLRELYRFESTLISITPFRIEFPGEIVEIQEFHPINRRSLKTAQEYNFQYFCFAAECDMGDYLCSLNEPTSLFIDWQIGGAKSEIEPVEVPPDDLLMAIRNEVEEFRRRKG